MYPIIFALIIIACLAFLIPHQQLTRRLHKVEQAFLQLEETLRDRLDLIVEWTDAQTEAEKNFPAELKELCENARDDEADVLMKAYLKADKLLRTTDTDWKPLEENENKLRALGKIYNEEIEPYNVMLKKFPWKLYASALMIKEEEKFHYR